jgi:Immunoglobulin I-set domain
MLGANCMRLRVYKQVLLFVAISVILAGCGGTSNPGAVQTLPSITTQPSNQTVVSGQSATFSVTAASASPLSYQWQKGTTPISGATAATHTTPATTMSDNGVSFQVVVTNAAGSTTSNAATLTVTAAAVKPSITQQPSNQTVPTGQTATFSVVATGTSPLSYQWQKGTTPISGATTASYTTPATATSDNGSSFRVVVTNSAGSVTSTSATLTVSSTPVAPSITQQPSNQTVTVGQTATFAVVASGTATLTYQWQKGATPITGATSASYTTPVTSLSDSGSQFQVVVSNAVGNATSNAATLTVNAASTVDVLTYHNDIARTGQNLNETILTASNVNSATFGKIGFYSVDGLVDAEPLYASSVAVPSNGAHNLLIVPTEHDSVYAFDADTGTVIWKVSMLKAGEHTSDTRSCGQVSPEIGVTSTPVIDRTRGPNGTIYVVAMSKDSSGHYHQRLHALDLALGTELFSGPKEIQATYPGTGDNSDGTNVIFDPAQYKERVGLLLMNGVVYTGWASHCDARPYTGWIMAYDASTLAQTSVLNITPNGNEGALWMAGAGLAADNSGNIFFLDANGEFDTTLTAGGFPSSGDYGNAFMKLSTSSGLAVSDYFEMDNQSQENSTDTDLGSGGTIVLPDLSDGAGHTLHLAVGAGKDTNLYVVNRDGMGKFKSNNSGVYQQLSGALPGGVWAMPAYFNNTIYYGSVGSPILAFTITNARLSNAATAHTANSFGYPGATPSVSANGASNGIVWASENTSPGVLHAYNASNLNELYNSNQASGGRDQFGAANKYITPMIVNGRVFLGTTNGVAVFGLLP